MSSSDYGNKSFRFQRHLWIGRKLYLIPRSSSDIKMLIVSVMQAFEDKSGNVTFDNIKYKIDQVDIFERFLIHWLMAVANGESEPIMNENHEISVELQVADNTNKKPVKEYNHEK